MLMGRNEGCGCVRYHCCYHNTNRSGASIHGCRDCDYIFRPLSFSFFERKGRYILVSYTVSDPETTLLIAVAELCGVNVVDGLGVAGAVVLVPFSKVDEDSTALEVEKKPGIKMLSAPPTEDIK